MKTKIDPPKHQYVFNCGYYDAIDILRQAISKEQDEFIAEGLDSAIAVLKAVGNNPKITDEF